MGKAKGNKGTPDKKVVSHGLWYELGKLRGMIETRGADRMKITLDKIEAEIKRLKIYPF